MKTKLLSIIILFVACCKLGFAQGNSTEELKKEITNLKHQITLEKENVSYLKDALDLRNSGKEVIQDNVSIRITEVIGNSENQTISVKGIITNQDSLRKRLQFSKQVIVDPNGNTIESYSIVKPQNQQTEMISIDNIALDIPYAFMIKFNKVIDKTPVLSLLQIEIYSSKIIGKGVFFNFKGLDVKWN